MERTTWTGGERLVDRRSENLADYGPVHYDFAPNFPGGPCLLSCRTTPEKHVTIMSGLWSNSG